MKSYHFPEILRVEPQHEDVVLLSIVDETIMADA